MADYWISQNRKYCDFCKCWITDNRPSVDFHEKGRRHQENVKKRLRNITKHSNQTQRSTDKMGLALKQMEAAAMESYRKDIETNGDLSSMEMKRKLLAGSSGGITKLWNEVKMRDGRTCYKNIMTNETVWQAPKEGFMSVQEQRDRAEEEARKQLKALETQKRKEGLLTLQETKQQETEERARLAREKLKERRVVDDTPAATCGPLLEPGKTNPYGRWQTVKETEVTLDLQLPQQEYFEPVIEYEPEPVVKEFKEKTVESLGDGGESSFKKRKFGGSAKRNTRQRLDDD